MRLTRIEKNDIYKAISRSGLDPAEFELKIASNRVTITHVSDSNFDFHESSFVAGKYQFVATVKDGTIKRGLTNRKVDEVLGPIRDWANEIKLIGDAPDLWAELRRSRELIANVQHTDSDNTPFTRDEQRQISAQLQEIKEQIKEQFELTNEQIEQIDARLDEAEEASKRIGRKDWLLLFGGTILNLIVTDTVTPSVAGHILTMVVQGLAHLFGAGPPQILS